MKSPATPSDNSGKMMTRRIQARDRTSVMLTYSTTDAFELRKMVQSIRLKGDKKPSLSLIARRSLQLYGRHLEQVKAGRPDLFAAELTALERMVTPVPQPARKSKKATTS